jgi:hypothetical protein
MCLVQVPDIRAVSHFSRRANPFEVHTSAFPYLEQRSPFNAGPIDWRFWLPDACQDEEETFGTGILLLRRQCAVLGHQQHGCRLRKLLEAKYSDL